jgi:hypothetical protein
MPIDNKLNLYCYNLDLLKYELNLYLNIVNVKNKFHYPSDRRYGGPLSRYRFLAFLLRRVGQYD